MISIPTKPKTTSFVMKARSSESIEKERAQNNKLRELGIDPYEYVTDEEYTEEEQDLINEALKLIILEQEIPEDLAKKVKSINSLKTLTVADGDRP